MIVLMVQLNVDPERLDQFMEASKDVARASVHNEPGCRRFDIVQDENVPTRVAFTEIFDDEAAVYAHPRFEHYPKWRAATADGSLAQGQWERVLVRKCQSVFPDDNANYDSVIAGVDENAPFESIYVNHSAFRVKPERVDDFIGNPAPRRSARFTKSRAACASTSTRPSTSHPCCGSTRCTRTGRRSKVARALRRQAVGRNG